VKVFLELPDELWERVCGLAAVAQQPSETIIIRLIRQRLDELRNQAAADREMLNDRGEDR